MSEASASTACKPRRRWLQFSLRTLLLVMLLSAVAAAWLGAEIKNARARREAIAWVSQRRGWIEYHDEAAYSGLRARPLRHWVPGRVKSVDFARTHLCGRIGLVTELGPLGELKDIQALNLLATDIRDIAPLAELENLRELNLGLTRITDLSPLMKLNNLERLDLRGTRFTATEIQALRQALPNCEITYE